jgi:hypothetical protein
VTLGQVGCAGARHPSLLRRYPALSWRCVSQHTDVVRRARAQFFAQVGLLPLNPSIFCSVKILSFSAPQTPFCRSQRFKPAQAYACTESIFDLPFQRRTFDSILYFGLKMSMDQQHARLLLCDAARVVKPNGIVALVVGRRRGGASSVIGPAWTRGQLEKPAGERDMGGWISAFYTTEQQQRLLVDEFGVPLNDSKGNPLRLSQESFTNAAWLQTAASTCGFELLSTLTPAETFSGFH